MALTPSQLQDFRGNGYAVGDHLLDQDELAQVRANVDRLIAARPERQRPENMPARHYDCAWLRGLCLSDKLVDVAEQILGPDLALFATYIISKRPDDGLAVAWHQHTAFFPIELMETFTIWLAVDDADIDNGCMQVLPGTHRERRVLTHGVDQTGDTTLPLAVDEVDLWAARPVELKAGSYSVHDVFLIHGSNPNRSNRRRCGITVKYIPTHVHIEHTWVSPTGFDWKGLRLCLARGKGGGHEYWRP